jgi:hypothetical protein
VKDDPRGNEGIDVGTAKIVLGILCGVQVSTALVVLAISPSAQASLTAASSPGWFAAAHGR